MTRREGLPRGIWALGLVSMFMDISSEMIHSILPMFLVGVVGVSVFALGLIEGVAEAVASLVKLYSGAIADRWGRRKPLVLLGYGMAALSKPLFPLADGALTVLIARVADRIGKGIRGAPRDALIADLTRPEQRGAAYGLRQALDSTGAFLGPLVAIGLLFILPGNLRAVMWAAVVPATLAVAILIVSVREPTGAPATRPLTTRLALTGIRKFPRAFWSLIILAGLLTLARFSEAFLLLRAQSVGVTTAWLPGVLVLMNVAYMATAYPAGLWADRAARRPILLLGCAMLLVADLLLAAGDTPLLVAVGAIFWGLHLGLTEGLFATLVSDQAPAELRATAFGVLNLVRGVLVLPASGLAGWLWSVHGAGATFAAGACFVLLTILGLAYSAIHS